MLGLCLPASDRGLILPITDRDTEAVGPARRLHTEITRHAGRDLDHALGGSAIALVVRIALRGEDHGVIRRRRTSRETGIAGCHRRVLPQESTGFSFKGGGKPMVAAMLSWQPSKAAMARDQFHTSAQVAGVRLNAW